MKGGNPFGPNQRRKFQLQQQPLCPSFTREGRHPRCLLCVFNGQVSFEIKLSYKSCNILIKLPFFLGPFPKISKPPLESRKGLQGNLLLSHILTMSGVYRGTCKTLQIREGQRPRCPRFVTIRATRTLPLPGFASVSINYGHRLCFVNCAIARLVASVDFCLLSLSLL